MTDKSFAVASTLATVAASGTVDAPLANADKTGNSPEARVQVPWRRAGTFSNLRVVINSDRAAATLTIRLDTGGGPANGNLTITTTSSPAGEFSDTTHSDTITAGTLVDAHFANGSGGTTTTYGTTGVNFLPTISTVIENVCNHGASSWFTTAASTTSFMGPLGGHQALSTTTEANVQQEIQAAVSIAAMFVFIQTNGRSTTGTFSSRVNGANGNLTISVTAGTTGLLEDTTHSDIPAVGDLFNLAYTSGTGAGSMILDMSGVMTVSTKGQWHSMGGDAAGVGFGAASTLVTGIGGATTNQTTANRASTVQTTCGLTETATRIAFFLPTNTSAGSTTVALAKGGTASALTATATSAATGWFTDTTHSVSVTATDKLDVAITQTSGVGTATLNAYNMLFTGASDTNIGAIDGVAYPTNVANVLGLAQASIGAVDGLQ